MPYYVRLMRKEDVTQAIEIDRESFPSQWPPPDFQYELRNRVAHYIVASNKENNDSNQSAVKVTSGNDRNGLVSRLRGLFRRHHLFSNELPPASGEYITGFAGLWVLSDEAHLTSIAVRAAHRRQGIGELLLISAIDLATELKARIVTLEVRVSNTTAQSLYTKYGFSQVGIRRGYYTDNREDATLMSTQDITLATFQIHLQQLKQAHSRKCEIALYQIVR